jgi:hypothetical protein
MKRIFKASELKDAIVVAEFRGEKVLLKDTNYFYVPPKQVGTEKAILLPFAEGIRTVEKIKAKKLSIH